MADINDSNGQFVHFYEILDEFMNRKSEKKDSRLNCGFDRPIPFWV